MCFFNAFFQILLQWRRISCGSAERGHFSSGYTIDLLNPCCSGFSENLKFFAFSDKINGDNGAKNMASNKSA
jgi:hypothetical protein